MQPTYEKDNFSEEKESENKQTGSQSNEPDFGQRMFQFIINLAIFLIIVYFFLKVIWIE